MLQPEDVLDKQWGLWKNDKCNHILNKEDWRIIADDELTHEEIGNLIAFVFM